MSNNREKFKPGAKRPATKEINDDLGFGLPKAEPIKNRFGNEERESKNEETVKSLFVRDVDSITLDTIKNIVYTEKMNGDVMANQSSVINQALKQFIDNYEEPILERPEFIKAMEQKKSKR